MSRGIIYIRVSSDDQVKGTSLDFQRQDCLAYAAEKGIELAEVFAEEGESAKFADRPELINLLEYARKHRKNLNALIVWKIDRLSRIQMDYYYLKRTLLEYGITIHSATERSMGDPDSIAGRVYETFSALQAEIDNTLRSERTRRGMEAKIMAGITPWKPPIGYICQHAKKRGEKKLQPDEPDPILFPIIQSCLRDYAQGRLSQKELGQLLDERGMAEVRRTKAGAQFVMRLLYDYLNFYRGYLLNPWKGELVKGAHQPMLTEEEYLEVVAVRDGRRRNIAVKRPKYNGMFPLRRTLICADCSQFYTASVARGNGGLFPYYHCKNKGCPAYGKSIRKLEAELSFAERMDRYVIKEKFIIKLGKAVHSQLENEQRSSKQYLDQCDRVLTVLEDKRKRLYEMREDGSYTKEEFLERKAGVEAEILEVKTKRLSYAGERESIEDVWNYAANELARFGTAWSKMAFSDQQRFQKFALPAGISYHRKQGLGTAQMCCLFTLNEQFGDNDSPLVPPRGFSWNPVWDDLKRITKLARDHPGSLELPEAA